MAKAVRVGWTKPVAKPRRAPPNARAVRGGSVELSESLSAPLLMPALVQHEQVKALDLFPHRAQGVLHRSFRLDDTLGWLLKQRTGTRSANAVGQQAAAAGAQSTQQITSELASAIPEALWHC
jgi:hypothetical protein